MSNNNIQKIITKEIFDNEETKQQEGLYYVVFKMTDQKYKIRILTLEQIKEALNKGEEIYEIYKGVLMCSLQLDLDDFDDTKDFKNLIICLNDIITDYETTFELAYFLHENLRIDLLAYGIYENEDIKSLYKDLNINEFLNIHYKHKDKNCVKRNLSARVVFNCYVSHDYIEKLLTGKTNYKLTNKDNTIYINLDTSIYKDNGLLRIASSNKTDPKDNKFYKTAINITDEAEFKRQFLQYPYELTEQQKDIYEITIKNIINKFITYDGKKSKTDTKDEIINQFLKDEEKEEEEEDEDILNEDDTDFLKPPLGLIVEILGLYPVVPYDKFICCKGNVYWRAFSGFIKNCPYKYEEISDILNNYYNNKVLRNTPEGLNDYVKIKLQTKHNNKGYYSLIKCFKAEQTLTEFMDSQNFDITYYNKLLSKKQRELSKKQREDKKTLSETYYKLLNVYKGNNKNINYYEKFKHIFNVFQTFELKRNEHSLYNVFMNKDTGDYIHKGEYDIMNFNKLTREKITGLYKHYNITNIIKTSFEEYKIYKNQYLYSTNEEIKKGHEIEECLKTTFINEFDFNIWCDFVRHKLNNIKTPYKLNFLFVGEQDSLKTTFMNIISKFINVNKGNANDIGNHFNSVFESDIVLFEEMSTTIKNVKNTIDFLKDHTSAEYLHIERKGQDIKTIKNYSNIVITTNFNNLGGLFDYQEDKEMFKRFYIIKRTQAEQQTIKQLFSLINNEKYLNAFINILKNKQPLTYEELNNKETQQEWYNKVKDKRTSRKVLTEYEIDNTIRTDSNDKLWLKLSLLISYLNKYNIITSRETERQQLETENIIKYYKSNSTCKIKDIYKFYIRYLEITTKEEEKKIKDNIEIKYKYKVDEDLNKKDYKKQQPQEEPIKETIKEEPIKETIKEEPIKETIKEEPIKENKRILTPSDLQKYAKKGTVFNKSKTQKDKNKKTSKKQK